MDVEVAAGVAVLLLMWMSKAGKRERQPVE